MKALCHGGSRQSSTQLTGAVLAPHVLLLAPQLANGWQQHWLLLQLPAICRYSCPFSSRQGCGQPAVQQLQQLGLGLA
jgi:hypothetical protein